MKAGHYHKWAEKAFAILDKFHSRMYELGGEESKFWDDDLNCRHSDLDRALDDDNYDRLGYDSNGYFMRLQKQDAKIHTCDWTIEEYQEQIKELRNRIKKQKEKKEDLKKQRLQMIKDFDMDYKTIEARLSQEFPEFVEGA